MWLFLLFIGVPIIEIALFIQVGGVIGLWPTLAIVVLTAFLGTSLMRAQGIMTLNRLQEALATGGNPTDPMAQGAMILVAGVLLLTPGFFTDAIGFALLIPPVRVALMRWIAARLDGSGVFFATSTGGSRGRPDKNDAIDGDYTVLNEDRADRPRGSSGWTKR